MEEYDIVEENRYDEIGCVVYYKKGTDLYHRLDGPAIEYEDGEKYWYLNGLCHRLDGPAIEWADGYKFWCINGVRLSPEKEAVMNLWFENQHLQSNK